jgi:hypothetical protein
MGTLITAILTKAPAFPQHAGPLLEILNALLSKDPAQRPDAQTTARALAACRDGQFVSQSATSLRQPPTSATTATGQPYPTMSGGPQGIQFRGLHPDRP